MEAPDPLQQQVDRSEVGDQQVDVDIERLLGELGRHDDQTDGAHGGLGQLVDQPLSALGTGRRCEPGVEQNHVVVQGRAEAPVDLLRAVDGVADDQRAPALGDLDEHGVGDSRRVECVGSGSSSIATLADVRHGLAV